MNMADIGVYAKNIDLLNLHCFPTIKHRRITIIRCLHIHYAFYTVTKNVRTFLRTLLIYVRIYHLQFFLALSLTAAHIVILVQAAV